MADPKGAALDLILTMDDASRGDGFPRFWSRRRHGLDLWSRKELFSERGLPMNLYADPVTTKRKHPLCACACD
jgi:hypothetical protein